MNGGQDSAIIIPVHNRKAVTLANLNHLRETGILSRFSVIVVDDGSTDGTSEAVSLEFPEVILLRGDGNLFWTGAMELGMRHAVATGTTCCIWLNDDLEVSDNAIDRITALAAESGAIVTGQGVIRLEDDTLWFFPGIYKTRTGVTTREIDLESLVPIPVDTCRGNLVAIPLRVIQSIGYPDGHNIPHVAGDTDYGLRATDAGFQCFTLCDARFFETENIRNDNRSWLLGGRPLREIWGGTLSRRGNLYPRMLFTYNLRHWGVIGILNFCATYLRLIAISLLRLLVPKSALRAAYGNKSHSFKAYKIREEFTDQK